MSPLRASSAMMCTGSTICGITCKSGIPLGNQIQIHSRFRTSLARFPLLTRRRQSSGYLRNLTATVWLQSMHTTRGDHILSCTSTTHMVNLLADLATQCQFSIPTSHLRPSPCQFSNSSGLQYSVTTMMSSLDSVVISVYFFACVTYIVKSHS